MLFDRTTRICGIVHHSTPQLPLLIYCVLSAASLSLYKCAEYVPGEAHPRSKYRRLLRFIGMKHANLFCQCVAKLLLCMAPASSTLVMDRTNWKRGEKSNSLLGLGLLIHNQFYLPLLCEPLGNDGASSELERIGLMKQCSLLPTQGGELGGGYLLQDTGYRIQDTGYRIQDTGYRI